MTAISKATLTKMESYMSVNYKMNEENTSTKKI
jgi:hypothetical protein